MYIFIKYDILKLLIKYKEAYKVEEEWNDKKTILIVDDEKMILNLLSHNLSREGYNIIEASDGVEAIKIAQESKPDLILLD